MCSSTSLGSHPPPPPLSLPLAVGSQGAYLIFIAKVLASLWPEISVQGYAGLTAGVMVPFVLMRDMSFLKWTSMLGNAGVALVVATTLARGAQVGAIRAAADYSWFNSGAFTSTFGIIGFLYSAATSLITIEKSMTRRQSFGAAYLATSLIVFAACSSFALVMALLFGDCTRDMIVLNLGGGPLAQCAKLAIVIDLAFSYPLSGAAAREIVEKSLLRDDTPHLEAKRSAIRIGMTGLSFLISFVPSFSTVLGIVGGWSVSALSFTLPCLMLIQLRRFHLAAYNAQQAAMEAKAQGRREREAAGALMHRAGVGSALTDSTGATSSAAGGASSGSNSDSNHSHGSGSSGSGLHHHHHHPLGPAPPLRRDAADLADQAAREAQARGSPLPDGGRPDSARGSTPHPEAGTTTGAAGAAAVGASIGHVDPSAPRRRSALVDLDAAPAPGREQLTLMAGQVSRSVATHGHASGRRGSLPGGSVTGAAAGSTAAAAGGEGGEHNHHWTKVGHGPERSAHRGIPEEFRPRHGSEQDEEGGHGAGGAGAMPVHRDQSEGFLAGVGGGEHDDSDGGEGVPRFHLRPLSFSPLSGAALNPDDHVGHGPPPQGQQDSGQDLHHHLHHHAHHDALHVDGPLGQQPPPPRRSSMQAVMQWLHIRMPHTPVLPASFPLWGHAHTGWWPFKSGSGSPPGSQPGTPYPDCSPASAAPTPTPMPTSCPATLPAGAGTGAAGGIPTGKAHVAGLAPFRSAGVGVAVRAAASSGKKPSPSASPAGNAPTPSELLPVCASDVVLHGHRLHHLPRTHSDYGITIASQHSGGETAAADVTACEGQAGIELTASGQAHGSHAEHRPPPHHHGDDHAAAHHEPAHKHDGHLGHAGALTHHHAARNAQHHGDGGSHHGKATMFDWVRRHRHQTALQLLGVGTPAETAFLWLVAVFGMVVLVMSTVSAIQAAVNAGAAGSGVPDHCPAI